MWNLLLGKSVLRIKVIPSPQVSAYDTIRSLNWIGLGLVFELVLAKIHTQSCIQSEIDLGSCQN